MTTEYRTPYVTVTVEGTTQKPTSGTLTIAALDVPYARATVVLPLTAETLLDDLDPRDDHRVVINGSNTGHWQTVLLGFGDGPFGHGPFGHYGGSA